MRRAISRPYRHSLGSFGGCLSNGLDDWRLMACSTLQRDRTASVPARPSSRSPCELSGLETLSTNTNGGEPAPACMAEGRTKKGEKDVYGWRLVDANGPGSRSTVQSSRSQQVAAVCLVILLAAGMQRAGGENQQHTLNSINGRSTNSASSLHLWTTTAATDTLHYSMTLVYRTRQSPLPGNAMPRRSSPTGSSAPCSPLTGLRRMRDENVAAPGRRTLAM